MSNNFARLLEEKQTKEGRFITLSEVSRETGVMRPTLYRWSRNEVTRFDEKVIDALTKYFGVSMSDLINHTREK